MLVGRFMVFTLHLLEKTHAFLNDLFKKKYQTISKDTETLASLPWLTILALTPPPI